MYKDLFFGIGLGFLFQLFGIICIFGSMIVRANFLYISISWLLMGLSVTIAISLYHIYGIVPLIGFIIPEAIAVFFPSILVFWVGMDTMSYLFINGIKSFILLGLIYLLYPSSFHF